MPIDVRIPIGVLFLALGLLLVAQGAISGLTVWAGQVDTLWGTVMAVFGLTLTLFGLRAPRG